ncbi:MAG: dienelactone hydrolase family protein [Clostridiales bacterium]|nr:dienelactone hydrolase family protein [Clostridiales bacterium]
MWNQWRTDEYNGMLAEMVTMKGYQGDRIHAYFARPLGDGPYPGVILIPHMPGWDEINFEIARRFAHHGYMAICPNIYERAGHGLPAEISAKSREVGAAPDVSVMGDCEGALDYLTGMPMTNGKVGVIGMCSGGRHAFLAGCRVKGLSAAVDCWGGGVAIAREDPTAATPPVAAIAETGQLGCPLLGIFGNDDKSPPPDQVDMHEAALKEHGKEYEFHRYDGAGHGFWSYDREAYRPVQTMDSWEKVLAFFGKHLQGGA